MGTNLYRYLLKKKIYLLILREIMQNIMSITLLGTGTSQGVPVIACNCSVCTSQNLKDKRLRSAVMIEIDGITLVIDTGPDFRQQMLRENVRELNAVIFTHHHKDHVAGLDDIRAFNYTSKKDMPVYCTNETKDALMREFPYIFSQKKYPGVPRVEMNVIENKSFNIHGLTIVPIQAMHYIMPVFGFRIKNFVYLTDVSSISSKEKEKMKDADLIILDALRKENHISHFNLDQALVLLEELKPKRALLTHISHYMGLHDDINTELPGHIQLAYDGQKINLEI